MDENMLRLSDRIIGALDLALEQKDVVVSEMLFSALDQALTRTAGGGEFVERRSYPDHVTALKHRLDTIKGIKVVS